MNVIYPSSVYADAAVQQPALFPGGNNMSSANEDQNLAIFCDFENVALGVRDARIEKFDINLVLERLLVKGSVVVKKLIATGRDTRSSKR